MSDTPLPIEEVRWLDEILGLLGMHEEGNPVERIEELLAAEAKVDALMQREDMANVGEAFMEALQRADPDYSPCQCPSEWVFDQINKYDERVGALMREKEELIERCAKVCEEAGYSNQLLPTENLSEQFVMAGAKLQAEKLAKAIRALVREQNTTQEDLNSTADLNGGATNNEG